MKILICGLPGSGKTVLAEKLFDLLEYTDNAAWFNADIIRKKYDDWDFSIEGRERQARRMRDLANASFASYVICDFVAPTQSIRDTFAPDFTIWMNTIQKSRFPEGDHLFEPLVANITFTKFEPFMDICAMQKIMTVHGAKMAKLSAKV